MVSKRFGRTGARRLVTGSGVVVAVCAAALVAAMVTSADASSRPRPRPGRHTTSARTATATPVTTATATSARTTSATSATSVTSVTSATSVTTARTATATGTAPGTDAGGTVTYQGSDAVLANPERGLSRFARCDQDTLSAATLAGYRSSGETVVQCMFYLSDYRAKDLDAAVLARLDRQLATVREAGLKTFLRFAYTEDPAGSDATAAQVLRHIAQLKPHLRSNTDVIMAVQAGFVGAWGEWYYTKNFGDQGRVTTADGANRKAVVDALLDAVGARQVQVRTPAIKRALYGTAALDAAEARAGTTARSRVGFHNDCFLASDDDQGTYTDPVADKAYLAGETQYVMMGGETCAVNPPRTSCPAATAELGQLHFTYLNRDYHPDVLGGWSTGGCLDEIRQRLGYRITLQQGAAPASVARSAGLPVRITLRNDGWAAPVTPRPVQLVLRPVTTAATGTAATGTAATGAGTARRVTLDGVDPRTWSAGRTVTLDLTVPLPSDLPAGAYRLALALPDADAGLAGRPEYAIRTANTGLWDERNGWNDLARTVTITG